MCKQDWILIIVGFLIGLILTIIIVWMMYAMRMFVFSYCPYEKKLCGATDYISNPGEALASGAKIDDILFMNSDQEIYYKRVPKANTCLPTSDQDVRILHPQYCLFRRADGTIFEAKNREFGGTVYDATTGTNVVISGADCQPSDPAGSGVTSGIGMLKWDPQT